MFLPHATALPVVDAGRLRLRPLTRADVPALFAIFGDPVVCRYWSRPPLAGIAAAEALLTEIEQGFAARSLFQWGISGDDDAILGTCTLASLSMEHQRAEVGFALAREAWGHGVISTVLPPLLHFAFGELGLHRIEADADPRNERSIRVLERLGFQREGLQRQRYLMLGERQDALLFGLLRQEWPAGPGSHRH